RTSSATASSPRHPEAAFDATTRTPAGVTSVRSRSAPSLASFRAIARPKPLWPPLPVTMATLPSRRPIHVLLARCSGDFGGHLTVSACGTLAPHGRRYRDAGRRGTE